MVLKSAVETGLVESGLRNLSYGDADSQGWRQERASLYRNPTNLQASINRYFDEAQRARRSGNYGTAGQLAAAVQRPAAQYRGRYDQVSGRAERLLSRFGNGAPGGVVDPGQPPQAAQLGALNVGAPDTSALTALLSQETEPAPPAATPIAPPEFSAARYLPSAGSPVPSTQPAEPQGDGLAAKLAAIGTTTANIKVAGPSVAGKKAQILAGTAIPATGQPGDSPITAPGSAPDRLRAFIERANQIDQKRLPYVWGGGHARSGKADRGTGRDPGIGFDCSGAVSAVLGVDPRVSGQFAQWGKAGRGKQVTIYANSTHVLMEINGHFFGTSRANPGGGAGWIPRKYISKGYLSKFTARHPRGL